MRQFTCSASNTQKKFQSTHSLRSATAFHSVFCSIFNVSIHALLAECDLETSHNSTKTKRFNPRTPCGVRPLDSFGIVIVPRGFNPRTPCGVRPIINGDNPPGTVFQSTHSLRSATQLPIPPLSTPPVSIHALLAECDTRLLFCIICIMRFNPRTPCGVRHKRVHRSLYHLSFNPRTPCGVRPSCLYHRYLPHRFQSTHSLRSATPDCYFALYVLCVSIHALLAECDTKEYTALFII